MVADDHRMTRPPASRAAAASTTRHTCIDRDLAPVLGFGGGHHARSVFGDFGSMQKVNPLGPIPSLILDGGEVLIDSAALLDWLEYTAGAERTPLPRGGMDRRRWSTTNCSREAGIQFGGAIGLLRGEVVVSGDTARGGRHEGRRSGIPQEPSTDNWKSRETLPVQGLQVTASRAKPSPLDPTASRMGHRPKARPRVLGRPERRRIHDCQ